MTVEKLVCKIGEVVCHVGLIELLDAVLELATGPEHLRVFLLYSDVFNKAVDLLSPVLGNGLQFIIAGFINSLCKDFIAVLTPLKVTISLAICHVTDERRRIRPLCENLTDRQVGITCLPGPLRQVKQTVDEGNFFVGK